MVMRENIFKAMIMSAGIGSRLEPLTLEVPKPLVPVCNRPVMDILLEYLSSIGIKEVVCNTYYLAEQIIKRYQNNNLGVDFNYIKEDTLSGTAGGLKKCQYFFNADEDFVVLSADGLSNADIKKGIDIHLNSGAIATIGVKKIDRNEVSHFGVVVTDKDGFINEFQEKPAIDKAKSDLINTGIYIFNYKIFSYIPENTFYDFAKDVFPKLIKERQINTFKIEEYWSDIGTIEQYRLSNMDVFKGECDFHHGDIKKTKTGEYITDSVIPDDTKFLGYSVIGSKCQIGKNVTIENCILWNNVKVLDNVCLKNCIVTSDQIIKMDTSDKVLGRKKLISV